MERERARLVMLPNGDQEVMGSTPTFHSGVFSGELRDMYEVCPRDVRKINFKPKM